MTELGVLELSFSYATELSFPHVLSGNPVWIQALRHQRVRPRWISDNPLGKDEVGAARK